MSVFLESNQEPMKFRNLPGIDLKSPVLLFRSESHSIFWMGMTSNTAFRCNTYLIRDEKEAILIDPGGKNNFDHVKRSVAQLMDPAGITAMILSHQDPDVAASMTDWIEINPSIRVISSPRAHILLPHYGRDDYIAYDNEANPHYRLPGGADLIFLPAPFLHFPGAFVTYDAASRFLFSGDVWSSLDTDWKLFADSFDEHIAQMDLFHKDYMASGIATRGFARSLGNLKVEAILPQHGSIIGTEHVSSAFKYLENLECGLDLTYIEGDSGSGSIDTLDFQEESPDSPSEAGTLEKSEVDGNRPDKETLLLREALNQSRRLGKMRDRALRALRKAERRLQESETRLTGNHKLIKTIDRLREEFIAGTNPFQMFTGFLNELVSLSMCEYGILGETIIDEDDKPYLKIYAMTGVSGGKELSDLYSRVGADESKLRNPGKMFGAVIQTGRPVISNDPGSDLQKGELPAGHPEIRNFLGIPVYFGERLVGVIGLANRQDGFDEKLLKYLEPVVRAAGQIIVARQEREIRRKVEKELEKLVRIDPLTGIYNRRSFDEYIRQEWLRAARTGSVFSLILLDVDHFKLYNDHYGHQAGDLCLAQIGRLMEKVFRRPADHVARYGGEEFVVVLPETHHKGATGLAEKLQTYVRDLRIENKLSPDSYLTLSIGVVTVYPHPGMSPEGIIAAADECLYAAKASGRNRIVSRAMEDTR